MTNYGTGTGFKGWNCRHDWFPFFEGISDKAYSDKELEQRKDKTVTYDDKTMSRYDAEQKQRAMERQIRKERSKLAALDAAIKSTDDEELKTSLKNDFDNLSVKLKSHEAKYKDFSYKTGLPPQKQRLQMYGFGRSVSQKAVHANKSVISSRKAFTNHRNGDTINYKVSDRILNMWEEDSIRIFDYDEIEKEILSSPIGQDIAQYIVDANLNITMDYSSNVPEGVCAKLMNNNIIVYVSNNDDVQEISSSIIHEAIHKKYNWTATQEDEINCYLMEHLHKHNEINDSDIRKIVSFVKKNYSYLPEGDLYGY